MATVQSTSSANQTTNATSITVTKPTGLSVGDYIVVFIMLNDTVPNIVSTKSGWSLLENQTCTNGVVNVQSKVADSSDVAASNFTFDFSDTASKSAIYMYRISGQSLVTPAQSDSNFFNTAPGSTFSLSISLTPPNANNLILVGFSSNESPVIQSMQDYSVTGATVSFTELTEYAEDLGTDGYLFVSAYGTQTTTATLTGFGADFVGSGGHDNLAGVIVMVAPITNASGTNTLVTTTTTTFTQSGTCDGVAPNNLITATSATFTQGGEGSAPTQWTNEPATTTTWTNET